MPRVSVIVPVHNAASTVAAAIESILAQTFTDFEIVAVDDGSTDQSRAELARFGGRVVVVAQQRSGPSAARNTGVRASRGEYLGFLDADDWWRPEMLARTVAALDGDRDCVLVYSDLALVDSAGRELMARLAGPRRPPTLQDMLRRLWPIMPSGVVMRRAAFDAAGGFPEALTAFEDVYFWLLVREHGQFQYIPEPLAVWRFALFPEPLKRGGGQEAAGRIFERMISERYGVSGRLHVTGRRRAPRSILGYIGLRALHDGDRKLARRALARSLRFDPLRVRNYLRYARTFLPAPVARALGGRHANLSNDSRGTENDL